MFTESKRELRQWLIEQRQHSASSEEEKTGSSPDEDIYADDSVKPKEGQPSGNLTETGYKNTLDRAKDADEDSILTEYQKRKLIDSLIAIVQADIEGH